MKLSSYIKKTDPFQECLRKRSTRITLSYITVSVMIAYLYTTTMISTDLIANRDYDTMIMVEKKNNTDHVDMQLHDYLKPLPHAGLTECHETCCVHARPFTLQPYRPEEVNTTVLPTHQDRVGIFEERQYLAEIWYGDLSRPSEFHGETLTQKHIPCLQNGTIIFTDLKYIERFFTDIYPHLTKPFVLFSTDSDSSAPSKMVNHMSTDRGKSLMLHWYSTNCDHLDENLPLFTCIPIGLSQWEEQQHQRLGLESFLDSIDGLQYEHGQPVFPAHVQENRNGLALLAFSTGHHKDRAKVWALMCNGGIFEGEKIQCKNDFHGVKSLYETGIQYKFMISPHGIGLDCYRTWEALFLGMIPVVKTSSLDPIYRGLPVLIVKEWEDLTPKLLNHTWEVFQHKRFKLNSLYISYWQQQFWHHREHSNVKYEYMLKGSSGLFSTFRKDVD